jgi:hypothetical protein
MSESEMHEDPGGNAANISRILNSIYDYQGLNIVASPEMTRDQYYPVSMKAYKGE